jgi:hypothetical protein
MREKIYEERLEYLREEISRIDLTSLNLDPEDLVDKFCDPNNPVRISFNDVSAAAYKIKGGVDVTPCTVNKTIQFKSLSIIFNSFSSI